MGYVDKTPVNVSLSSEVPPRRVLTREESSEGKSPRVGNAQNVY